MGGDWLVSGGVQAPSDKLRSSYSVNEQVSKRVTENGVNSNSIMTVLSDTLVHRFRNNYTTHLSANPIAQV